MSQYGSQYACRSDAVLVLVVKHETACHGRVLGFNTTLRSEAGTCTRSNPRAATIVQITQQLCRLVCADAESSKSGPHIVMHGGGLPRRCPIHTSHEGDGVCVYLDNT